MGAFPQTLSIMSTPVQYGPNADAETVIHAATIRPDILEVGAQLKVEADGLITTVGGQPIMDIRLRLGPVTLTGVILGQHHEGGTPAADVTWRLFTSNNQTNKNIHLDFTATVQAGGISIWGNGFLLSDVSTQFQYGGLGCSSVAAQSFDPTITNLLELTMDFDDLAANIVKITNMKVTLESYGGP